MSLLGQQECGAISRGYCPDCNHPGFRLGPRGGSAINIECMNQSCRARFNVAPISGFVAMAHRIEPGAEWPTSVEEISLVQAVVGLMPADRVQGLRVLEEVRAFLTRTVQ